MSMYRVRFEDIGFSNRLESTENELSTSELGGFNEVAIAEAGFPPGVLAVLGAYVTPDDGQGKTDIKVFVSIALAIEADSLDEAEQYQPPLDLLTRVADMLAVVEDECVITLENQWERADDPEECDVLAYDDGGELVSAPARGPRP